MFIGPRDDKACKAEIEAVEEYSGRVFGIEVDYLAFKGQVREIIHQRINDYIFQRFRDWPIRDLFTLEGELNSKIDQDLAKPEDPATLPRRGRPPKVKAEAGL